MSDLQSAIASRRGIARRGHNPLRAVPAAARTTIRPLRVLHVTDSEGVYGAESVILDLCAELRALGQTPVIASIGEPGLEVKPLEAAARQRGLEVRPVRMRPGLNLAGALRLARLARDEAADVIHTHGYKGDILLGLLPRAVRKVPLVSTVHGFTDLGGPSRLSLYYALDRLLLRRADRVVLVHRGLTGRRGLDRLHDPRWRVIENGIRPADPAPDGTLDPAIVRFCRAGGAVVGTAGRLSPEKGFDVALRALAELRSERVVRLLLLGEGPERATLERLAAELGVADRVLLPGYRADARRYMRLFDVFILPSLTEGLPITLLEAMQAGVPIVATRVGGVAAVLDEGCGGLLVPPGDAARLAASIRRCLEDRDLAAALAAHARRQAAVRFTSRAMAVRYLELYRELAGT
ncbi:MAG TPA: glycosyltransferase [Vicinamibacterales bacterium]|nr:glycosyltransferase [Vicinamibacterales bacterium]